MWIGLAGLLVLGALQAFFTHSLPRASPPVPQGHPTISVTPENSRKPEKRAVETPFHCNRKRLFAPPHITLDFNSSRQNPADNIQFDTTQRSD